MECVQPKLLDRCCNPCQSCEIVRNDMFEMQYSFSGSFAGKCEDDGVPE